MMTKEDQKTNEVESIDRSRRELLGAAGGGLVASVFGGIASTAMHTAQADTSPAVRWGIVGTGSIANAMAGMIKIAGSAELVAVSSRKMETANAFAGNHGIDNAFDSWADMAAWDGIDAVYVATPTSVREEICVAAANSGKHVLGEKPFASLPSLQRITAACRTNDVGFMDGTHFVHHPRTAEIKAKMGEVVGWPWSLDSAFQFYLPDRSNIRFRPELEPLGAIGDAGWYNMRVAVEYLSPGIQIQSVNGYLRRDQETSAAISGSGVILFDDGSTTTWNCGFDSGAVIMDLRISGANGVVSLADFLSNDRDGSASYSHRKGGFGPSATTDTFTVASSQPGAALMFEDFAAMVADERLRDRSIESSERTQRWLDAIWNSALANEKRG
jgi:predicted dehydrogenase